MPLDTAIRNVGEYCSTHYLDTAFAEDIRDLKKRWTAHGMNASSGGVRAVSDLCFLIKVQAVELAQWLSAPTTACIAAPRYVSIVFNRIHQWK